jgi:AcrR family transcriptional regulator
MAFEPLTPERRRAMTRQHLLDAAAIVFARDGFSGATLDDIAATAGFTKGAVYSNFKSKDDLFLALLDDRIDRQLAITSDILEDSSPVPSEQLPRVRDMLRSGAFFSDDTWSTLFLEFVLYSRRNPEAAAKLSASAQRSRAWVTGLIEMSHREAGITPKYQPEDLAKISLALFEGLGYYRMIDPTSVGEDLIDTVLDFLYHSMDVEASPPE